MFMASNTNLAVGSRRALLKFIVPLDISRRNYKY